MTSYDEKGILQWHDPVSWRFYVYGEDEDDDPLFSFWMNLNDDTGVCLYERNDGAGKWLGTSHDSDEYQGLEPTEGLKDCLADAVANDEGVRGEDVEALPDYEAYFFRLVHGTAEEKRRLPPSIVKFLEECVGTEVTVVE